MNNALLNDWIDWWESGQEPCFDRLLKRDRRRGHRFSPVGKLAHLAGFSLDVLGGKRHGFSRVYLDDDEARRVDEVFGSDGLLALHQVAITMAHDEGDKDGTINAVVWWLNGNELPEAAAKRLRPRLAAMKVKALSALSGSENDG